MYARRLSLKVGRREPESANVEDYKRQELGVHVEPWDILYFINLISIVVDVTQLRSIKAKLVSICGPLSLSLFI